MEFCTNHKEALDKELIKKKLIAGIDVHFKFPNKDILAIMRTNDAHFPMKEAVHLIEVVHAEFDPEKDPAEGSVYNTYGGGEYWPVVLMDQAIDVYLDRLNSETPQRWSGKGYKPCEILVHESKKVLFESHYDYLNRMLRPFWLEVFGKTPDEMWCGGIVTSHGDKCYGYKSDWAEKDINFNRGSLLFLLTYTKEFGENKKHLSREWVIDNYAKYLPAIEKAEAYVLEHILDKDLEDPNC